MAFFANEDWANFAKSIELHGDRDGNWALRVRAFDGVVHEIEGGRQVGERSDSLYEFPIYDIEGPSMLRIQFPVVRSKK